MGARRAAAASSSRQDARRARLRPDRPAGRPARARARHAGRRLRPVRRAERFRELGVEHVETREEVFDAADFLTLHLPLTDETRGFVGADAIAKMRDGVRIVNAARGELVDEPALADALRSGKVAGAALDVFSAEPYEGPLLGLENVVDDAAPRGLDRGGAGSRGRDRRRAGRRGARRRPRHERRQHPGRRRRGPRGARPVHPARGEARTPRGGARRRPPAARSPLLPRRRSPSTTRACSPSRRSTAPSRAASTRRSTTSTRP